MDNNQLHTGESSVDFAWKYGIMMRNYRDAVENRRKDMTNRVIVAVALFYMYYHIGGLATTNILRLTRGNTLPVLSSRCVCDACGAKIGVLDQFPIVSYLACRGKCRNCGVKIPVFPLMLEIAVAVGMIAITVIFRMSWLGVILSFAYYEVVRIAVIALKGRREAQFARQYVIAVLIMFTYWIPTLFAALLYAVV